MGRELPTARYVLPVIHRTNLVGIYGVVYISSYLHYRIQSRFMSISHGSPNLDLSHSDFRLWFSIVIATVSDSHGCTCWWLVICFWIGSEGWKFGALFYCGPFPSFGVSSSQCSSFSQKLQSEVWGSSKMFPIKKKRSPVDMTQLPDNPSSIWPRQIWDHLVLRIFHLYICIGLHFPTQ